MGYLNPDIIINFKRERRILKGNSLKQSDFHERIAAKNPLIALLTTKRQTFIEWNGKQYTKNIALGNDSDIMMVLDVLRFITSDDDHKNSYTHIKRMIRESGIKQANQELINLKYISDKIASFIVRDIVLMNPELTRETMDYENAFPVDTWVNKIAAKLGCSNDDVDAVKTFFINECKASGVNPFKVAAGLWYTGFHALDIVLKKCLQEESERGIK